MKPYLLIILSFFFAYELFACSGNCLLCHPVLEKSINQPHHKLLNECIKCHATLKIEENTACGGDCFQCHSKQKLFNDDLIEHRKLTTCKQCHFDKEKIFEDKKPNGSFLIDEILKF